MLSCTFFTDEFHCLYFQLDKKVTNLSADRQEIKAENHFLEIIFRLALHATQAVSQVVCFSVLAHSWVAYSNPSARQAFVISSGNAFSPFLALQMFFLSVREKAHEARPVQPKFVAEVKGLCERQQGNKF